MEGNRECYDPIILRVPGKAQYRPDLIGTVRITPEAETELRYLAAKTTIGMRQLASMLILEAIKRVEIRPLAEGDSL